MLVVPSLRAGAVQAVDFRGLARFAREASCLVVVRPAVGDFVPEGAALFAVYGGAPLDGAAAESLRSMMVLGIERTIEQDPAFAIRVMVDIAIRALSPAVNDPTTAVQVLDHLGDTLRLLGAASLPPPVQAIDVPSPGVVIRVRRWDDVVELACTEIRQYGGSSVQVVRRLSAMLEDLREQVQPEHRRAVEAELARLDATIQSAGATPSTSTSPASSTDRASAARARPEPQPRKRDEVGSRQRTRGAAPRHARPGGLGRVAGDGPDVSSCGRRLRACRLQSLGEELERLPGLRLLLAGEVDARARQERPRLRGDLERLGGRALGRELEDARVVRVEPHLGDELAAEALRRELELEHEDRAQDREVVELDALRRVLGVERPLLLREQLAQRPLAGHAPPGRRVPGVPFIDPEQTNPPGIASTSTPNAGERAQLGRELGGDDRPQLDDRVVALSLHPPRADDDAGALSARSGVSKKNTWRIWASSGSIPSAATAER